MVRDFFSNGISILRFFFKNYGISENISRKFLELVFQVSMRIVLNNHCRWLCLIAKQFQTNAISIFKK